MSKCTRLINWHISADKCLHGNVVNHPKLSDGMYINTTSAQTIKVNRKDKSIEVQTRNTLYVLPFEHCCFDRILEISEILLNYISREDLELLTASAAEAKLKKDEEFKAVTEKLGDNQYYLVFSTNANYYFDTGVYKSAGEGYPVIETIHVGTIQDSVILNTPCMEANSLSYFPYKGKCLGFYGPLMFDGESSVEEGTLLGYIKNSGIEPILVKFTWGAILKIHEGEEVPVYQGMLGNADKSEFNDSCELYPADYVNVDIIKGIGDFDTVVPMKETIE